MKQNPNYPKAATQPHTEPDKTLTQLEEMWDRLILKGDDDLLEKRDRFRSIQKPSTNAGTHEEPKQGRSRRKRII